MLPYVAATLALALRELLPLSTQDMELRGLSQSPSLLEAEPDVNLAVKSLSFILFT